MEEAFTFAAAGPFIVAVLALVRAVVPELRGRIVPPVALGLTLAWGAVLAQTGRFSGDLAEFIVATVIVASAAIGLAAVVSTFAPSDSTIERVT
jgi:hypothetical protein